MAYPSLYYEYCTNAPPLFPRNKLAVGPTDL